MHRVFSVFLACIFCVSARAGDAFEELFPHPTSDEAGAAQVALVLGKLATAAGIYKLCGGRSALPPEIANKIDSASARLEKASEALTQAEAAIAKHDASKALDVLKHGPGVTAGVAPTLSELEKAMAELATANKATHASIAAELAALRGQIAASRGEMLSLAGKAAPKSRWMKFIKGWKISGEAFIIADIAARGYIWFARDRNPGFFPLTPLSRHYAIKVGDWLHEQGVSVENARGTMHSAGEKLQGYKQRMDRIVYPDTTHK